MHPTSWQTKPSLTLAHPMCIVEDPDALEVPPIVLSAEATPPKGRKSRRWCAEVKSSRYLAPLHMKLCYVLHVVWKVARGLRLCYRVGRRYPGGWNGMARVDHPKLKQQHKKNEGRPLGSGKMACSTCYANMNTPSPKDAKYHESSSLEKSLSILSQDF